MECEHGWRHAADCDACTLRRVAPLAADRIAELEAAILAITYMDSDRKTVHPSFSDYVDLGEKAPILRELHLQQSDT